MIASFADDELRRALRRLSDHIPFAPRSVEKALERIAGRELLAPVGRHVEMLLRQARSHRIHPPDGSACAFPTVTEGAPVPGAVFFAVAELFRPPGYLPIGDAFSEETEMLRLLGDTFSVSLSVYPNPAPSSPGLLRLVGDSAGAAFAVAGEALRRGVSVPEDVAVSAALSAGPDGNLHLRGVGALERKIALLEQERPGCRFYFVDREARDYHAARIRLVPLRPGAIQALYEAILPRRDAPPRARVYERIREAERAFRDQDYPVARRLFGEILPMLDLLGYEDLQPRRWRYWSLVCLGAIALHAGDTDGAARCFEEAERLEIPRGVTPEKDELELYVAGLYLDQLLPDRAEKYLRPLTDSWRQRMRIDPAGDDRRRVYLGCLGGMRRLHLLRGEPERAHAVQEELVAASPEHERARSLTDLGEVLRRMGRREEAALAFRAARRWLDHVYLPTYRLQTEAFLVYYEGRLALDRGEEPDLDVVSALVPRLPERSAASWRLRQLALLARLRRGEDEALDALLRAAREARGDFSRWQWGLGLLRALAYRPEELREEVATHFEGLSRMAAGYAPIERAHRGLVDACRRGEDPLPFARLLLHHSPY